MGDVKDTIGKLLPDGANYIDVPGNDGADGTTGDPPQELDALHGGNYSHPQDPSQQDSAPLPSFPIQEGPDVFEATGDIPPFLDSTSLHEGDEDFLQRDPWFGDSNTSERTRGIFRSAFLQELYRQALPLDPSNGQVIIDDNARVAAMQKAISQFSGIAEAAQVPVEERPAVSHPCFDARYAVSSIEGDNYIREPEKIADARSSRGSGVARYFQGDPIHFKPIEEAYDPNPSDELPAFAKLRRTQGTPPPPPLMGRLNGVNVTADLGKGQKANFVIGDDIMYLARRLGIPDSEVPQLLVGKNAIKTEAELVKLLSQVDEQKLSNRLDSAEGKALLERYQKLAKRAEIAARAKAGAGAGLAGGLAMEAAEILADLLHIDSRKWPTARLFFVVNVMHFATPGINAGMNMAINAARGRGFAIAQAALVDGEMRMTYAGSSQALRNVLAEKFSAPTKLKVAGKVSAAALDTIFLEPMRGLEHMGPGLLASRIFDAVCDFVNIWFPNFLPKDAKVRQAWWNDRQKWSTVAFFAPDVYAAALRGTGAMAPFEAPGFMPVRGLPGATTAQVTSWMSSPMRYVSRFMGPAFAFEIADSVGFNAGLGLVYDNASYERFVMARVTQSVKNIDMQDFDQTSWWMLHEKFAKGFTLGWGYTLGEVFPTWLDGVAASRDDIYNDSRLSNYFKNEDARQSEAIRNAMPPLVKQVLINGVADEYLTSSFYQRVELPLMEKKVPSISHLVAFHEARLNFEDDEGFKKLSPEEQKRKLDELMIQHVPAQYRDSARKGSDAMRMQGAFSLLNLLYVKANAQIREITHPDGSMKSDKWDDIIKFAYPDVSSNEAQNTILRYRREALKERYYSLPNDSPEIGRIESLAGSIGMNVDVLRRIRQTRRSGSK